jgi:hypothetical protein
VIWLVVGGVVLAGLVVVPLALSYLIFSRVPAASLHTCSPADVPATFGSTVAEFVQLGFVVAGALRITNAGLPDAYVLLFVSSERQAYGRLWISAHGSALFSVSTPLAGGRLATSQGAMSGPDPTELLQVFPEASLVELCERHAEAQAFLTARGVAFRPVALESADAEFRLEWQREIELMREWGVGATWEAAWRSFLKRPRYRGALAQQRDIKLRVARLRPS